MNFGKALETLKTNGCVTRAAWNSADAYLQILAEKGGQKVITWRTKDHPVQAYHPTSPDLLAEDWEVTGDAQ